MIRLKINCRKNASVLYHFTPSWSTLDQVVTFKKLFPSMAAEPHGQESKKFQDDPKARFISTTRTPSTIYNASTRWRYGLILDGGVLSDTKTIRPYDYNMSNHKLSLFVSTIDGKTWSYFVDSDESNVDRKLNKSELMQFLKFYNKAKVEDKRFKCFEEDGTFQVTFTVGKGKGEVPPKDLPPILQMMLRTSGYESEERIFSDEPVDISKALMGVLIPDTQYFTDEGEDFRKRHSNVKMYVYRDPYMSTSTPEYKKFKEAMQADPGLKQLYRLPI